VSGSVSPVTARQIATAQERGFAPIRIAAERAVDARTWESEIETATHRALAALAEGQSPLVFSAQGPDDPAVARLREAVAVAGLTTEAVNDRIGAALGTILDRVLRETRLTRAVISGGDTSSHAAAGLGIDALTAIAPMAPGAPLCRAHAPEPERDGLELVLKGGQVGSDDVFDMVRQGAAS